MVAMLGHREPHIVLPADIFCLFEIVNITPSRDGVQLLHAYTVLLLSKVAYCLFERITHVCAFIYQGV